MAVLLPTNVAEVSTPGGDTGGTLQIADWRLSGSQSTNCVLPLHCNQRNAASTSRVHKSSPRKIADAVRYLPILVVVPAAPCNVGRRAWGVGRVACGVGRGTWGVGRGACSMSVKSESKDLSKEDGRPLTLNVALQYALSIVR